MSISRVATLPAYFNYIIDSALLPAFGGLSPNVVGLATADLNWVEIPSYQRGISWDILDIEDFLGSSSVLLGNVIRSQFPLAGRYPNVPNQNYVVLVDGLQRFAVGTMLLKSLYDLVLSHTPQRQNDSAYFTPLAVRVRDFAPVYQHNDIQFRNHPRRAISDQYTQLADQVHVFIIENLQNNPQEFSANIISTFLNKKIALDTYFNFNDQMQLMNTFLGLNTIRVDLGPVDLLRANLVEQATAAAWQPQEIEAMENDFTSIFTKDEKPDSELLPFVAVVLQAIKSAAAPIDRATQVFTTWRTGLNKDEVQNFLGFVRDFKTCRDQNGFFDEIRECGSIPFAILITYYYRRYLNGRGMPSFVTGGVLENDELHKLLLAVYRVLLDGRISRTRVYAERVLEDQYTSLANVADQISNQFLRRDISTSVDIDWLKTALNRVDKNRARRIFNAMLLPEKATGWGTRVFEPNRYGQRSQQYQIDHLIPETMKTMNAPGVREINTLRNFAPLLANQNRVAKATSCSSKLGTNGIYDMAISNGLSHPYCIWLVQQHAPGQLVFLDAQRYLEANASPSIGDERIDYIADYLIDRL